MRFLMLLGLLCTGCQAAVGTGTATIPDDAVRTCRIQCTELRMELGAMVTMASNVGCVCQVKSAASADGRPSAAVVGGMAAVLLQDASRRTTEHNRGIR